VRSDDPRREWTFAPDLAAALERAVEAGPMGRAIHLGSPHVWRDREVAGLIAASFPGTEVMMVPAEGRMKPPMVPSDVPGLRGFAWTDLPEGLRALVADAGGTDAVGGDVGGEDVMRAGAGKEVGA
jgi:UDP-glucose 4-epimerase